MMLPADTKLRQCGDDLLFGRAHAACLLASDAVYAALRCSVLASMSTSLPAASKHADVP
jgi:hypothetical protein